MKTCIRNLIFCLSFGAATVPALADELVIGIGQQGADSLKQEKPARGLSQQQVLSSYGQPETKRGPTGTPPIETWDYGHFSVYFEGDYVIHSVIKHVRQDGK